MTETNPLILNCDDLDEAVRFFTERLGFRVDMTFPADEPVTAVISGHGAVIRLERSISPASVSCAVLGIRSTPVNSKSRPSAHADGTDRLPTTSRLVDANWVTGRAGMEYRDLIPGRLDGRLIASHIRLNFAGEVPDYVHYHKVGFQMIYCWHGRVRVVYQDCGEPFWLHPGDCVLQPPEIRHRVLECVAGAQVIELSSPAVHETWTDHDMTLPTGRVLPDRDFGGQRFVHHRTSESAATCGEFGDFECHDTGIAGASNGAARVIEMRSTSRRSRFESGDRNDRYTFYFLLTGTLTAAFNNFEKQKFTPGDSILIPPRTVFRLEASANSALLCIMI